MALPGGKTQDIPQMGILMGFLGSVFALSISLPPDPVVLIGQCTDTHKIPIFLLFFFKKKQPPQPSERLCCLTCNLGISSLSFPSCCSLPNNQQLNPAFLPHFYRFLGYKRFHLLMHVPVSPLPRRGLVPWCSEHRDGDRGTSLVCRPRCHQASPCPRWIFGLRVGFFCARVVCARLRIPLLPFNWCC